MLEQTYERLAEGRLGLRALSTGTTGIRLLCLPFAGGQSLAFRPLAEALGAGWQVAAVDTPGHGWASGPPIDRVDALAALLATALPPERVRGTVIYGHSLGGTVGFALAERLMDLGLRPAGLIVGGTVPPHRIGQVTAFASLPVPELIERLRALGGLDEAWIKSPHLLEHFLPPLRADFRAFEAWAPERPARLPLLAVGGVDDPFCLPEFVFEWSRHAEDCRVDFVEGGHLFAVSHPAELAARVRAFASSLELDLTL